MYVKYPTRVSMNFQLELPYGRNEKWIACSLVLWRLSSYRNLP